MQKKLWGFLLLIFSQFAWADSQPAAIVLGQPLFVPAYIEESLKNTSDPTSLSTRSLYRGEWLREEIMSRLMQPYLKKYDIKVLSKDLQELADVKARGDVSVAKRILSDKATLLQLEKVIMKWKINRFLYHQFGGKVFMEQAEEIPVGAQEAFLRQEEKEKHFFIADPKLKEEFWYAYSHPSSLQEPVAADNIDLDTSWWANQKKNALGKIFGLEIYDDGSGPNVGAYLRWEIIPPLIDELVKQQKIVASDVEIAQAMNAFKKFALERAQSTTEIEAEFKNPKFREYCKRLVLGWKIDQYLYKKYGGIVMFQQANPLEPVGAMRQFLKDAEKDKKFVIYNKDVAENFWSYYEHPIMVIPKDHVNFDTPWWLQKKQ